MNKFLKIISILIIGTSAASAQKSVFKLTNPVAIDRRDELIVINRAAIERKMGKIPEGRYLEARINGDLLGLQFDDLDHDGQWDELLFLRDFKPNETAELNLSIVSVLKPVSAIKAHVRQRRKTGEASFGPQLLEDQVPAGQPNTDFSKVKLPPFLTEGPAWENDKVGFRIYMDVRNTKDIWGKRTAKMMMDTVGANPKEVYHNLADWGMDILAVGKSLGAGSLALYVPRKGKPDTLVRLGGVNMGKIRYERVADGPYRATFRMHYPEWNVLGDGKLASLTEEITIWGGQYFYESNVSLKNAPAGAILVAGIVTLKSKAPELIRNKVVTTLFTYDQQSENKDNLGLAIAARTADIAMVGKTSDDEGDIRNTYFAGIKAGRSRASVFRFYSGWALSDPAFATHQSFENFLQDDVKKFENSITIK